MSHRRQPGVPDCAVDVDTALDLAEAAAATGLAARRQARQSAGGARALPTAGHTRPATAGETGHGDDALSEPHERSVIDETLRRMSLQDASLGHDLSDIAAQLEVVSMLVADLRMPDLADFLLATGERLKELAEEALDQPAASRNLNVL